MTRPNIKDKVHQRNLGVSSWMRPREPSFLGLLRFFLCWIVALLRFIVFPFRCVVDLLSQVVVALHCIVVRWNERWILRRDGCCLGCCGCVRLMLCWIVVMLSFVVQRLRCIVGILIHLVVLSCSFVV